MESRQTFEILELDIDSIRMSEACRDLQSGTFQDISRYFKRHAETSNQG